MQKFERRSSPVHADAYPTNVLKDGTIIDLDFISAKNMAIVLGEKLDSRITIDLDLTPSLFNSLVQKLIRLYNQSKLKVLFFQIKYF